MALAGRGESTCNLFLLCAHGVEATRLPEPWSILTATPEISGMSLSHRQSRAPGPPSLGLRGREKQRQTYVHLLPLGDAVSGRSGGSRGAGCVAGAQASHSGSPGSQGGRGSYCTPAVGAPHSHVAGGTSGALPQ